MLRVMLVAAAVLTTGAGNGQDARCPSADVPFKLHELGRTRNESVAVADFDSDGRLDILSGEYLYLAPDFKPRRVRVVRAAAKAGKVCGKPGIWVDDDGCGYAEDFMTVALDVNGDGRPDVVSSDVRAQPMWWNENRLPSTELWPRHDHGGVVNYCETGFPIDLDGDGQAESFVMEPTRGVWSVKDRALVCDAPGPCPIGTGCGDLLKTGRRGLVTGNIYWERLAGGEWKRHDLALDYKDAYQNGEGHRSNVFIYDVNGDGLNDLIFASAHKYGIFWWEQKKKRVDGKIAFVRHVIDATWTQAHNPAFADLDGDGVPEFIAGKRYGAHGNGDPDKNGTVGIWYYSFTPGPDPKWTKHCITSGGICTAGLNLIPVDIDGDGDLDLVTASKKGGPWLLENLRRNTARPLNIFNLDSTHYTHEYGEDRMNAEGLRAYVHRVLGKGAFTHFFICPGAQTTLCDTKTMSPTWWRMGEPGVPLNDHMRWNYMMYTNGVDTIQVEIDAIRAHKVSPWISMRMNDNHEANNPKSWLHSKFWVDHPEYRRQGGFNYSVPAVCDYHLAFVEEMLARYDVDGFECDWMRWPIPQDAAVLTVFMRRVRAAVDAAAKRRGHPILLAVRVASRPGQARKNGTDAILWAQEKLVDWIVPANFFGSVDFDLPQDEWQRLVSDAGSSALVIPCLDTGVQTRDPKTGRISPRRMLTLAEYCGWAKRMYDRGAPGVYYFNLFTYFEKAYHVTDTSPWDFILAHGLTPESIRDRPAAIPANWVYEP